MKIEDIIQEYNMKRVLRDTLPTCDAEISILEEDEKVQKYIRLKAHQERYNHLRKQTDDDILDNIITDEDELIKEDIYFCYGKDFIGHPKKAGGYYIDANQVTALRSHGIRVTKYRNLTKPNEIIIIPSSEALSFEAEHQTIFRHTAVPDEEFYEIRRSLYRNEMRKNTLAIVPDQLTYFCLGKHYRGTMTKEGRCIIGDKNTSHPFIQLAYYKNIDNPDDVVIIPTSSSDEFEKDKRIIYYQTNNPEQEYRNLIEKLTPKEDIKRLVKEPKHDQ